MEKKGSERLLTASQREAGVLPEDCATAMLAMQDLPPLSPRNGDKVGLQSKDVVKGGVFEFRQL